MTKKERDDDQSKKEEDKDFGLPEVEITPISKEEPASPKPIPIPPSGKEEQPLSTPVPGQEEKAIGETTKGEYKAEKQQEKKKKSNKAGLLILLLLFVGIIGFAAWYLSGGMGPGKENEINAPVTSTEESTTPITEPEPEVAEAVPEEPEKPAMEEEISMTEIDTKADTPRYFVVVGAFIDGDLARDYSDKLNEQGKSTFLILPGYGSKFHMLAIGDFDNVEDATAMIQDEQPDFEETLWVLKY